jgi:hypothetical protein
VSGARADRELAICALWRRWLIFCGGFDGSGALSSHCRAVSSSQVTEYPSQHKMEENMPEHGLKFEGKSWRTQAYSRSRNGAHGRAAADIISSVLRVTFLE